MILMAFGNPILDMSITAEDEEVLKSHGLKVNDQLEIPIERLLAVKKDAEQRYAKTVQFNPGGSSLNTCRILRALGEKNVLYCGSIGKDENGEKLLQLIGESGVNCCIQSLEGSSTAVCLCLIRGQNRCLIANIGAAFKIELSWLTEKINPTEMIYIEGYFIPERLSICQWLVEKAGKLAINLSAKYIVRSLWKELRFLLNACDLIFGNASEFSTVVEVSGSNTLDSWVDSLAKDGKKDRIIVITNGGSPVTLMEVIKGVTKRQEIPVARVENVLDTTGAGDAFVAGFLFAFLHSKSSRECVEEGIRIAGETLSQIGCHLPEVKVN
ncbi:uncharacterized protein LOC132260684 [Phlebotomus argentipes]|uniref:uncharacterized protein LOC132260684 n=1 Tax=Phlebotomus argentipes TaxID=94469 RepID=UPI0028934CB9|nr:uncharacterized protein LOC132260684 [Phlebotomus argentipes]XP_059614951.1 uncharacterized protein LOC132260684 [Phlebotomus argentipes]